MFKFLKKKEITISAPLNGTGMKIEEVKDPVFAEKMMGDGFAINYTEGDVYAPVDGRISAIVPSNHAFGITTDEGLELLVHVGLETVSLKGQGFKMLKNIDDVVKRGDKIIELDTEFLKNSNVSLVTPIIVTNIDSFDLKLKCESGNEIIANKTTLFNLAKK